MKTWVKIYFPENPKIKTILIKGAFVLNGDTLLIDADKKANDSKICLTDMRYHHIVDVKLVSINADVHPDMLDKYQTIILEGYYHKNGGFVRCKVEYKINYLDE